ncbi:MAG: extracellular solute-binding protein [[Clostridium] symbiosum]|uniref:extracellular solute-binding protein n=1 Tax=Roseburia hominis TaxID=301301 RepID=UPI002591DE83|nr:extracellular solute-binding protein [Roseburia hominis]
MRTKKWMSLAMSIAMLGTLTACGNGGQQAGASAETTKTAQADSSQSGETAAEETTAKGGDAAESGEAEKMTLILRGGNYADVIKAALPDFEKEHNVKIEVLDMSFDDLHTGIVLDAANEVGSYDLCMVDGSWMAEFTENQVLANLSEMGYSFDDDIIPNTTKICTVGDDIYLAPYFGNVTVMLYNKANVEKAGYKPEDIKTLEDMLKAAQAAKAAGVNGFAYRGDTGDNIVSDFLPILLANGGWVVDENNKPTVDTPEFKEAVNYYLELIGTGMAMSKDDLTAAVDNGSATLAIGWPGWYVPKADSAANYMVSPSMAKEGGTAYNTSEYGTWCIGIPANSPNPDLAMELLQYIMDPEVQLASVANGGVPCRYSCLTNEDVLKEYPHLATVCEALENGVYRPTIAQWTEFTNILGAEMSNIMAGTKTTDQGLADAQTQLEALMQ